MRTKWLLLVLFFIGSLALQPALAGKRNAKEDVRGMVVTSVDATNSKIVLTIEHNQQATVYHVPLGTTLTIDGGPAKLSEIHSGMAVLSYTESDAGTLSQLDVTNNQPAK